MREYHHDSRLNSSYYYSTVCSTINTTNNINIINIKLVVISMLILIMLSTKNGSNASVLFLLSRGRGGGHAWGNYLSSSGAPSSGAVGWLVEPSVNCTFIGLLYVLYE